MPTIQQPQAPGRRRRLLPAALVLAGILAYANSFSGVFLLDDHALLRGDRSISTLVSAMARTTRPVPRFTFYLNYVTSGFRPADVHAVNLALHVAAGLVLYGIVRRTLERLRLAGGRSRALGWCTAAVWLVHPLQTASVTYISQRAEVLMGLCFLLTLYCVIRGQGADRGRQGTEALDLRPSTSDLPRSRPWFLLAVLCCGLGMGSKPVMVTAPAMVLLYDRAFLAGSAVEALRKRRGLYASLCATWLVLLFLLAGSHESATSAGVGGYLPSPWHYLLTQPGVLLHYLRLSLWPDALCFDYGWPAAEGAGGAVLPGLALAALLLLSVWGSLRRHPAAWLGLWFFIILAPTSSLLPLGDCAFEHRMYLPLAAVAAGAVVGGHALLHKHARPGLLAALAVTAVAALSALTWQRNEVYASEVSMWRDVVRQRPLNLRARNDLAVALSEAGHAGEAMREYERVLGMIPPNLRRRLDAGQVQLMGVVPPDAPEYSYFRARVNLGVMVYTLQGDTHAAIEHLEAALRVIPYREDVGEMLSFIRAGAACTGDRPKEGAAR